MQSAETEVTYVIEAYVDDYISIATPASQEQLVHVATAVMSGIHDVFPADTDDDEDPISLKKMKKLEAMWALNKDILGFTFDGIEKTIWLKDSKRDTMPNNPTQVDPEWVTLLRRHSFPRVPVYHFQATPYFYLHPERQVPVITVQISAPQTATFCFLSSQ